MAPATGLPPASPLVTWRLAPKGYSSFDGEGARLYGGRWNHPGVRVVYTSGSLSLAVLEYFVHVDTDLVPEDMVSVRVGLSEEIERETVEPGDLPRDWRACPAPEALQDLGTEWIRGGESAVLSVPSVVVPGERNYLLNPVHEEFSRIRVGRPWPFHFDPRMWK